jgi:hypothetical protein
MGTSNKKIKSSIAWVKRKESGEDAEEKEGSCKIKTNENLTSDYLKYI